jgi:hypothetical protein
MHLDMSHQEEKTELKNKIKLGKEKKKKKKRVDITLEEVRS